MLEIHEVDCGAQQLTMAICSNGELPDGNLECAKNCDLEDAGTKEVGV